MVVRFIYAVLFTASPFLGLASIDTIRVTNQLELYKLESEVEFYADPQSELDIAAVVKEFQAGNGFTIDGKVPNFTGSHGAIWFRIILNNQLADSAFLSISNFHIENLRLYARVGDNFMASPLVGNIHPVARLPISGIKYVVAIPMDIGTIAEVYGYVRSDSRSPLHLPMFVGSRRAHVAEQRVSESISMAALGVLVVMLFYNFCLWIVIGDRLYLFYCFYLLTAIICVLTFTDYLAEWFFPTATRAGTLSWTMGLYYIGQLVFVNRLLRIRESIPTIFPLSIALYLVASLILLEDAMPSEFQVPLIMTDGLLIPMYFLISSVILATRAVRLAYIFLLGWVPILVTTVLNILMIGDFVSYSPYYDTHMVEVTLCWEVVIFSLALGYRYNIMRQEKIELQNENLKILSEQKSFLRQAILERTEEIMSQNEQLIRNQEQIKNQNERLETQNRAYEKLREMVLRQNQDLETAVRKRTLDLAKANEELRTTIQKLERFSYITAHNLRGPVARILGLSSLIDKKNLASNENRVIIDRLQSSAKDLDVIIHDLGAILAIQQGKVDDYGDVHFEGLVVKVLSEFAREIEDFNIDIRLTCSIVSIETIPSSLESILANLISNSIKYRSDSQHPVIEIMAREDELATYLTISDNGIGFDSQSFADKLFEPFQRFHTHNQGKGLGLFLIKAQVSLLGGTIQLSGQVDRGVRVEIVLPKKRISVLTPNHQ